MCYVFLVESSLVMKYVSIIENKRVKYTKLNRNNCQQEIETTKKFKSKINIFGLFGDHKNRSMVTWQKKKPCQDIECGNRQ